MELVREDVDGTAIIRCISERLDAVIAVQFKDKFRELVDTTTHRYVLDMSNVQFMDSSGLGAVVAVYKFLGPDRRFEIAGQTPTVDRVFKLTRMDSVFTIYDTLENALASGASISMHKTAS